MNPRGWSVLVVLISSVAVLVAAVGSGSAAVKKCTPPSTSGGTGSWTASGDSTWTPQGLLTSSQPDPTELYGVTCGGASVSGSALPTTDPAKITALSFDYNPNHSGSSGGSPRMIVCFSDGNALCSSNASLVATHWTAGAWTHVDGFSPATGLNASWTNSGGTCGGAAPNTWSAIVACHPGAKITLVAVVNDSGGLYKSGEQVLLNNLRVNGVFAHATPPQFGMSAEIVPTTGHVMIKRRGSHGFRRLKTVSSLRFGSTVDARGGRVQVIAATHGHGFESGHFYAGSFHLTQNRSGYVQAALTGRPNCPAQPLSLTARIASGSAPHLWGHVKGHYRTRGSYGSASVRGTIWFTENRCTGTYFHVVRGVLFIRDFTRHKNVILRAGHSYLAPSQPPDTADHDGDFNNDKSQGLSDRHR